MLPGSGCLIVLKEFIQRQARGQWASILQGSLEYATRILFLAVGGLMF
jgi:hypothetical protein